MIFIEQTGQIWRRNQGLLEISSNKVNLLTLTFLKLFKNCKTAQIAWCGVVYRENNWLQSTFYNVHLWGRLFCFSSKDVNVEQADGGKQQLESLWRRVKISLKSLPVTWMEITWLFLQQEDVISDYPARF